jgi:hypothetical protein
MGGCIPRSSQNEIPVNLLPDKLLNENYYKRRKRYLKIQDIIKKSLSENPELNERMNAYENCNYEDNQIILEELWEEWKSILIDKRVDRVEFFKYCSKHLSKAYIQNEMMSKLNIKDYCVLKIKQYTFEKKQGDIIENLFQKKDLFPQELIQLTYNFNTLDNKRFSYLDINETLNFDNVFNDVSVLNLSIDITHPIDPLFIKGISEFIESNRNLNYLYLNFSFKEGNGLDEKKKKIVDYNINQIQPFLFTAIKNSQSLKNLIFGFDCDNTNKHIVPNDLFYESIIDIVSKNDLISFGLSNFVHIPTQYFEILVSKIESHESLNFIWMDLKENNDNYLEGISNNKNLVIFVVNSSQTISLDKGNVIFLYKIGYKIV